MTLNQCTKEELIFIIKRMAFRSYFANAENEIERLILDVEYERQKKLLKEAENWNTISADCRNKYLEILKPYEGKRVIDVPLEVVKEAEKVLKDAQFADKKWDECMKKKNRWRKAVKQMRDRLIELIRDCCKYEHCLGKAELNICKGQCEATTTLADHLLANGVIAPPCKVGDTVYFPSETNGECEPYVDVGTVFAIGIDERHTMWIPVRYESGLRFYHTLGDFGETVFLTREDAEKALKERKKE